MNRPHPPPLESRFLEPPGWGWREIKRGGRRLRFGYAAPANAQPKAVVICLPGLGEFCEKYFETARDLLAQGLAVYVIDWVGQGRATRYLKNSHKRHSAGFSHDVKDLHALITEHVHPAYADLPLYMLAHSMGGHIGLRYLHDYPEHFTAAAFSAPMIGIQGLELFPKPFLRLMTGFMHRVAGTRYVPGNGNWWVGPRAIPGEDDFSSDPIRGAVHNAWCLADERLQVGNVTWRWLDEAVRSCALLQQRAFLGAIQTPCILACAGEDRLVDGRCIHRAAKHLPHGTVLELPRSYHEILMENDEVRMPFLEAFYALM
jgi:lysophospholipase